MGTAQLIFVEVVRGVTTGSDVTGRGPNRKYVVRMPGFSPRFFSY
jgi:hypothetical protein